MIQLEHYDFYVDKNGIVYYDNGVVADDGNALYEEYKRWIADGNTPKEWTAE